MVPILHAASFFRDQTLAFTGIKDWEKAVRIQKEGPTIVHPPIEEWQWRPDLDTVHRYLRDVATTGGPISFDFEATLRREVVCLGLWATAPDPTTHRGLCIPFLSQGGGRYWPHEEELRVMDLVREFFTSSTIGKIGQNAVGYDSGYPPFNDRSLMKTAWDMDIAGLVGDAFVAHHMCFSELRHSLAFQSSLATDLPPYKEMLWSTDLDEEDDDAADWARILDLPDERVRRYNLSDAFAQAVCWNALEETMR